MFAIDIQALSGSQPALVLNMGGVKTPYARLACIQSQAMPYFFLKANTRRNIYNNIMLHY